MALFQKSVLENYLSKIDERLIMPFWNEFQTYFLSPTTQSIIRQKKEEGKTLRNIVSILQSKGHKVSKSSLQRKLS